MWQVSIAHPNLLHPRHHRFMTVTLLYKNIATSNIRYWYGLLLPGYFVLIVTRRTHAVVDYLRLSEEHLIVYFDTILYKINKWYATIGTPVFVKLLCFM